MAKTDFKLPNRDPQQIQSMFNAISFRYDLLNRLMSFGLDKKWRKKLVKEAKLKNNFHILDLACGTGDIAITFYHEWDKVLNIKGIDFSEQMIEIAQYKTSDFNRNRLNFEWGDALKIDLPDHSVDVISMGFALRNLENLPKAFNEMARVLKPGGKTLCLELTRPKHLVLRWGHQLYLKSYVPLMGFLFSGDFKAYAYLSRSIAEFPPPEVITNTMLESGFAKVEPISLSGGIATIFVGEV